MKAGNLSQLFLGHPVQANHLFSKNKAVLHSAQSPANALQRISRQMIARQEGSDKAADLVKAQQLRKDTYTKTDSMAPLEQANDEVVQLYLHMTQIYATTSEHREKELLSFREHLQKIDQTIQGYQDIRDGRAEAQQGQSMEGIAQRMEQVKQYREQFLAKETERFNHGDAVYGNKTFDRYAKRVFGENPFAGKDPSAWSLNPSAPDFYAEIDRVVEETRSFHTKIKHGVQQLSGILKDRGYGDSYSQNWEAQHTEYRSSYDKNADAWKLEIERLMHTPLQRAGENP